MFGFGGYKEKIDGKESPLPYKQSFLKEDN